MERLSELKLLEDYSSISVSNTSIVKDPKLRFYQYFVHSPMLKEALNAFAEAMWQKRWVDVDISTVTLLKFGNLDLKGPARLWMMKAINVHRYGCLQ